MVSSDPRTEPYAEIIIKGHKERVSLSVLDETNKTYINLGINCAAQLGASVVALIAFLVISKPERRRTVLFALNVTALLCSIIQEACDATYTASNWTNIETAVFYDFSKLGTGEYALPILTSIFHILLIIFVLTSMVVQFNALCGTLRSIYRHMLVGVMCAMTVVMVVAQFWMTVLSGVNTSHNRAGNVGAGKETLAVSIILNVFIFFFSIAFMTKLGHAILARRRLGLGTFGPLKVIFIMTCGSMLIAGKSKKKKKKTFFIYLSKC